MALSRSLSWRHASRLLRYSFAAHLPRVASSNLCRFDMQPCFQKRGLTDAHSKHGPSEKYGTIDDKADSETRRRFLNRILYRSRQRGYLELDLLLGKWAEDNIHNLEAKELEALIEVLDVENPDLLKWLTGQDGAPESLATNMVFQAIRKQVSDNLHLHSSPDTRASPGQPWVRGWDDFRKLGGPRVGNQ